MGTGKIPVSAVYEYLNMMLNDKWGYIFGTAGVKWTQARQDALSSKSGNSDYTNSIKYGSKWIGHMVTDCSGAIVYIWKKHGLTIPHGSSAMVRQGYIVDCSSTPKPGYAALVDPTPDTPDNKHIGIVMADGVTVFEAKGAYYGCVTSKVTDSKWTKFGRFADVDYEEGIRVVPYYGEITGNNVRVRSGPGTEYEVIGHVNKGDHVKVNTDGTWCFCQIIDGEVAGGYISGQYIRPTDWEPENDVPDNVTITLTREEASALYDQLKEALAK